VASGSTTPWSSVIDGRRATPADSLSRNAGLYDADVALIPPVRPTTPPSDGQPLREITGPDADTWADGAGALDDLRFALEAVTALLEAWPPDSDHQQGCATPRALWNAALVSYARVFKGGVRRFDVDSLLERLPPDARPTHEYFMGLRDRHVAHSVNALEQHAVGVFLGPPPDWVVLGPGHLYMVRILEDRGTTETFATLTRMVGAVLAEDCRALAARVQAQAEAMSPDERERLPAARTIAPHPSTFQKSRRRK
jgi:hypothetical protein